MHTSDKHQSWKKRFKVSSFSASGIAKKAPEKGILLSNQSGFTQWYVWQRENSRLTQLKETDGGHTNPMTLSPLGESAYTLSDRSGNEIGHYVRYDLSKGIDQEPIDISPDLPLYASGGFAISGDGHRLGFIAVYDNHFFIYTANILDNARLETPQLTYAAPYSLFGLTFSKDGSIIFVNANAGGGGLTFFLLAIDAESGEEIARLSDGEGVDTRFQRPSPLSGESRILGSTSKHGTETLLLWDPIANRREDLIFTGIEGSVQALDWSPDGNTLLCAAVSQAEPILFTYTRSDQSTTVLSPPPGIIGQAYFTPNGSEIIAHHQDSTTPSRIISLDPLSGKMFSILFEDQALPAGIQWESVHFQSTDGEMIQGWLATPQGTGPFPLILNTHGGPTAVQLEVYSADAQTWLEHGFAYCSINYRGSITFGKGFEKKIWGDLGHWEVEDMVAARQWLIDKEIAHENAIFVEGRSYGGYLTLQSMGLYPGLWAGGMGTVAIADWSIQYEDTADTLRSYQVSLLGGTPTSAPESYRRGSPISYIERVDAPVMIIQGRHDTRTPARPIEVYEAEMKRLGKEIEVHWYETGHGGAKASTAEAIRHMELRLAFAKRVMQSKNV
ncbi:MAG: prolyl oligopeptidase family serine peptidase [Chloroflexota bacterium]